jgi:hypothetical protein
MDIPIFAIGKNKNHFYYRKKKVRALFISTTEENKNKKDKKGKKIKHTIIENNYISCIIFPIPMKP